MKVKSAYLSSDWLKVVIILSSDSIYLNFGTKRVVVVSCKKHTYLPAVRSSLEANGEMSQVKAEMRTKIMKILEGSNKSSRSKHPKSPQEVLIINELIREYLDWMGYKYSSSILVTECDLSKQPLDRKLITKSLGTTDTEKTKDLPVLFSLVETFKELKDA